MNYKLTVYLSDRPAVSCVYGFWESLARLAFAKTQSNFVGFELLEAYENH